MTFERFSRIMHINFAIKDCDVCGFLIRYQNVIITRSSVVGEGVPFQGRVSDREAKISFGERNENEEWSHIVYTGIINIKWFEEVGYIFFVPDNLQN
ncbi:hypothetical protein TNCV_1312781 [Trichonephila clavipes]|nr:hypothetical protein TNCV_1312781 [Trichonephila clavipes]